MCIGALAFGAEIMFSNESFEPLCPPSGFRTERSNRIDGQNANPNVDRGTGRRRFVNGFSMRRSLILSGFDTEIFDFARFRCGDL